MSYLLRSNDNAELSLIYGNLISNYLEIKNWKKLSQICEKKIKLELERGDKVELALTYIVFAVTLRALKKYDSSIKYHKLCINLAREIEDNKALATAYNDLGNTYSIAGKTKESEQCFLESIKIKTKTGNETGMMTSYFNLGTLYTRTGQLQKGIELLEKVEDYFATHNKMKEAIQISQYILNIIMEGPKDAKNFVFLEGFQGIKYEDN